MKQKNWLIWWQKYSCLVQLPGHTNLPIPSNIAGKPLFVDAWVTPPLPNRLKKGSLFCEHIRQGVKCSDSRLLSKGSVETSMIRSFSMGHYQGTSPITLRTVARQGTCIQQGTMRIRSFHWSVTCFVRNVDPTSGTNAEGGKTLLTWYVQELLKAFKPEAPRSKTFSTVK